MSEGKFLRVAVIVLVSIVIALVFDRFSVGSDKASLSNPASIDSTKGVTKYTDSFLKKEALSACLNKADENYEDRWAGACAAYRSEITREYNECMTLQKSLPKGYCLAKWDIPAHNKNCSLSSNEARYLDEQLQKNKEFCYQIFSSSNE